MYSIHSNFTSLSGHPKTFAMTRKEREKSSNSYATNEVKNEVIKFFDYSYLKEIINGFFNEFKSDYLEEEGEEEDEKAAYEYFEDNDGDQIQLPAGGSSGETSETIPEAIDELVNPSLGIEAISGFRPNTSGSELAGSDCSVVELSIETIRQFMEEIAEQNFVITKGTSDDDVVTGGDLPDFIIGLSGNDTLGGLGCNDYVNGNSGNDYITGGDHGDLLRGGSGNDFINGNSGNDLILGDKGNDTLRGGSGNDILNGGLGDDILYGDKGRDIFLLSRNEDVIVDFEIGKDVLGLLTGQTFMATGSDQGVLIDRAELGATLLAGVKLEDFNASNSIINI